MQLKYIIWLILPVHLFLLYSIFDIYFTSPLIQNAPIIEVKHEPLADRVVFIVIDGLPAKQLYKDNMVKTSFLKKQLERGISWGVSHTRVPTETRPGHVAIFAGFYEDVSSITKGWQENKVEFDSVFNQSRRSWAWGSPDVLPMFHKGVNHDRFTSYNYEPSLEDFAENDTAKVDYWVFERFTKFITEAKSNQTLKKEITQPGNLFFLHLLGMDISGHSKKPHSQDYIANLQVVDDGIERLVKQFDSLLPDGRTAYIISSDHGMTNWGSHGDGSNDETVTPIIAWGSGINKVKNKDLAVTSEQFVLELIKNLTTVFQLRTDIFQADICPLISCLLANPIPRNSVGKVPHQYLQVDERQHALILRNNIHQLFVQYKMKHDWKKSSRMIFFQEFKGFPMKEAEDLLRKVDENINNQQYEEAITSCKMIPDLILSGLNYYHNYEQMWLGFLISSTFILWILLLMSYLAHDSKSNSSAIGSPLNLWSKHAIIISAICASSTIYNIVQNQPMTYILYETIPALLLFVIVVYRWTFINTVFKLFCGNIWFILSIVLLIESIVWCFFYRVILLLGMLAVYLLISSSCFTSSNTTTKIMWSLICAVLAVYPILPVIGGFKSPILAFVGSLFNCFLCHYMTTNKSGKSKLQLALLFCQVGMLVSTVICQYSVEYHVGFVELHQGINWIALFGVVPLAIIATNSLQKRYYYLLVSLSIIYNSLSIYYEMLFLTSLIGFSLTWIVMEQKYQEINYTSSEIDKQKIIQTVIYIFLMTYSFFATGNIASISSFDITCVYCHLSVFRPFFMMFLIFIKFLIPLLLISLTYVIIQLRINQYRTNTHLTNENQQDSRSTLEAYQSRQLLILVTIIADCAALHFLFLIRNEGSWRDIGMSISHYVITMIISIGAFSFTYLARVMLNFQLTSANDKIHSN